MNLNSSIVRLAFVSATFALATSATCYGAANLVVNGDFELGNSAFTSGYSYAPSANTLEAQYTIRTDPYPWNDNFISHGDHTSGTGNMFVGNGDPTSGSIVWRTSTPIAVEPNTDYFFESQAMNVCCYVGYPGPNSPAVLEFSVIGNQVESLGIIPTSLPAGTWQFLGTTWNSGSNTSVNLQIINQNTAVGGNDFALDDIHFSTTTSLPEPASSLLACMGLTAFLSVLRRRYIDVARCPSVGDVQRNGRLALRFVQQFLDSRNRVPQLDYVRPSVHRLCADFRQLRQQRFGFSECLLGV